MYRDNEYHVSFRCADVLTLLGVKLEAMVILSYPHVPNVHSDSSNLYVPVS